MKLYEHCLILFGFSFSFLSSERCSHFKYSKCFVFLHPFFTLHSLCARTHGQISNRQNLCYANNSSQSFGLCFRSILYFIHLPQKCRMTHFSCRTQSSLPHICGAAGLQQKYNRNIFTKQIWNSFKWKPIQNFAVNNALYARSLINVQTIGICIAICHRIQMHTVWLVAHTHVTYIFYSFAVLEILQSENAFQIQIAYIL